MSVFRYFQFKQRDLVSEPGQKVPISDFSTFA